MAFRGYNPQVRQGQRGEPGVSTPGPAGAPGIQAPGTTYYKYDGTRVETQPIVRSVNLNTAHVGYANAIRLWELDCTSVQYAGSVDVHWSFIVKSTSPQLSQLFFAGRSFVYFHWANLTLPVVNGSISPQQGGGSPLSLFTIGQARYTTESAGGSPGPIGMFTFTMPADKSRFQIVLGFSGGLFTDFDEVHAFVKIFPTILDQPR